MLAMSRRAFAPSSPSSPSLTRLATKYSNTSSRSTASASSSKPVVASSRSASAVKAKDARAPLPSQQIEEKRISSLNTVRMVVPGTEGKKRYPPYKSYLHTIYERILTSPWMLVAQHFNLTLAEWVQLKRALKAVDVRLVWVRAGIMRAAIRDTPYSAAEPLFSGKVAVMIHEPLAKPEVPYDGMRRAMRVLAKYPNVMVLGAKIPRGLLNHVQLQEFLKLPPKLTVQAELLGLISHPAQAVTSMVNRAPQSLVMLLQQRVKDMEASASSSASSTAPAPAAKKA